MKEMDILRLQQTEALVAGFRGLLGTSVPRGGWVKTIASALGVSNVMLARRLRRKASQSVEDMLASEAAGTIKLNTLREMARALNCELLYAIVPAKPLQEIRRDRALSAARNILALTSHSMKLEDQAVSAEEQERAVQRLADKLLAGSARKLWEE